MELLPEDLRARLPSLYSQEAEDDPIVFARLYLPGTNTDWYLLGGETTGDDYLFYGFIGEPENRFAEFRLAEINTLRGPQGQSVRRDLAFAEGRLTDVVPAPQL